MNILKYKLDEKIELEKIDEAIVSKYHLTLPYYYVYQLLALMIQNGNNELSVYLDEFCIKKEENDDFRHGVIDAFCEIVRAGVKRIAFSHATNNLEYFANDLKHGHACAKKYNIHYYIEEDLIETCLFKNSGSRVIIFYSNKQDIDDYLQLKEEIKNNKPPTRDQIVEYGKELGRLLSYSPERIEAMINTNLHNFL